MDEGQEIGVGTGEGGIGGDDFVGVRAGFAEERGVGEEVGETEVAEAALHGAQDIAGATQAEVFFSDDEAVAGLGHDSELFHGFFTFAVC